DRPDANGPARDRFRRQIDRSLAARHPIDDPDPVGGGDTAVAGTGRPARAIEAAGLFTIRRLSVNNLLEDTLVGASLRHRAGTFRVSKEGGPWRRSWGMATIRDKMGHRLHVFFTIEPPPGSPSR